jgi:Cys-tRNA(Pro)/Cys-tRNA(Cys) deacylase
VSEVDMLGPLDIHQYLLAHDVHHEIVRLPRPAVSAETLAEVLDISPRRCVAVQPFHACTPDGEVLVLLLVPADETASLGPGAGYAAALAELLRDSLGPTAVLTPAGADLVSSHTDYLAGHLAPLLLPPDVIVVAVQAVVDLATSIVYTATGDGGTALGIRAIDLLNLCRAVLLPHVGVSPSTGTVISVPALAANRQIDLAPTPIHLDSHLGSSPASTREPQTDVHTVRAVAAMGRPRPFRRTTPNPGNPADNAVDNAAGAASNAAAAAADRSDRRDAGWPSRPRRGSPLRRPPIMRAAVPTAPVPPQPALVQTSAPLASPGSIKAPVATAS